MTELKQILNEMIEQEGPLAIDRYMGLCLGHPTHGYYMRQQPFGAAGDFITAPETSQVFGELIGIWGLKVWQALGRPEPFQVIELGPGRGLLMRDLLRAAKLSPAFLKATEIHLVEMSARLQSEQAQVLKDHKVTWHDELGTVAQGPCLIIANEFFDALPIKQFEWRESQWFERVVGRDGFGLVPASTAALGDLKPFENNLVEGAILELSPLRQAMAQRIGERLAGGKSAALIIDYGYVRSGPGDTLQALRQHQYVPVTDEPGMSDVTAHVDFEQLARGLAQAGARVAPILTQAEFLGALGAAQRFAKLQANAELELKASLQRQQSRLMADAEMGQLFKVLLAHSTDVAVPYPFGLGEVL